VIAERSKKALNDPYFRDQFDYDALSDSYICPKGQRLYFRGFRDDQKDYLQVDIALIEHREQSAVSVRLSGSVPKMLTADERSGSGLQIYYCGSTDSG
jgi:hypothetical protein